MSSAHFSVTNSLIRDRSRRMKCVTVSVLGFAIFSILLAYLAFGDKVPDGPPAIKFAYVIFRHGDRNPTETYPEDHYNDVKFWPGGWGALTNKGKLQMYNLGTFLRSRYKALLGNVYSPDRLLVRSSDNDRCLMSAGALLAGLLPPSAAEIWLPGLNWQPIPVHATPRNLDQLIVVKKSCPLYEEELKRAYKSEEIARVDSENVDLYRYLSSHTGQNISSVLDVEFLFNTLEIEEKKGFTLPEWTQKFYPEPMRELAKISMAIFTQTWTMKQLVGGPLINDLRGKVEARIHSAEPKPQLYLISGHDMTVINVMRALGFNELIKPDIGATLLFELHAGPTGFGENEGYVKLFYMNSSSTTEPYPLTLNGCNNFCSAAEFISVISKVAIKPDEWEEKCHHI